MEPKEGVVGALMYSWSLRSPGGSDMELPSEVGGLVG